MRLYLIVRGVHYFGKKSSMAEKCILLQNVSLYCAKCVSFSVSPLGSGCRSSTE